MVLSSQKTLTIIVIKNYVLTLITNDVADPVQVLSVLGDKKGSGVH